VAFSYSSSFFLLIVVLTESGLRSVKLWMLNLGMFMCRNWHDERLRISYQTTHWVRAPCSSKHKSRLSNIWQECCTFGQCQLWPIVNIRICNFLAFSLHEPRSPLALSACISETNHIQYLSILFSNPLSYLHVYTHIYFIPQARLVSPCSHLSAVGYLPSCFFLWASSVGITIRSNWLEKDCIT